MTLQVLVSIIILTHNRPEFLKNCIKSVIATTTEVRKEIIVWDNNSNAETKDYLKELETEHPFIKVIYSDKNIGVNAKRRSFEISKGDYIVGVDDDVIKFPDDWISKMIYAFNNIKDLGYLSLDVVKDEFTNGAKPPEKRYTEKDYGNGLILQFGPVGGWCFMIPRYIYKKVGKLRECKRTIFFAEDGDYIIRTEMKGLKSAILKNVRCYHATGEYHNKKYQAVYNNKMRHWDHSDKDLHKLLRKIKYTIFKIFN